MFQLTGGPEDLPVGRSPIFFADFCTHYQSPQAAFKFFLVIELLLCEIKLEKALTCSVRIK